VAHGVSPTHGIREPVDDRSTDGGATATVASVSSLTLALPADPADRAVALEVLAALGRLEHPHLVPSTVEVLGADSVRVDTEDLPGPHLPALLAGRRLSPGQVVTLGVPLAQALEAAAAVGVHHGSLELASIVVDGDGRPLLAGIGLAQLVGAHPTAPDDVHTLARLLAGLLDPDGGAAGAAVSAAMAGALSGHPLTRPAPGALAAQLLSATQPVALPPAGEPLRPVRTIHPPEPRPRRHRPELPPRRVLLGAGLLVLVVAVALLTRGSGSVHLQAEGAPPVTAPGPSPSPSPSPMGVDWQAQLTAIAAARQRAFAQVRPSLLGAADAPGSAAAAVDRSRLAAWARAGVHLRGDPAAVELVAVRAAGSEVAVLTVRERTAAFDEVSGSTGAVVGHVAAGTARSWTVTLVATAQGWRTASVSPA
jgi:hypothetical protein